MNKIERQITEIEQQLEKIQSSLQTLKNLISEFNPQQHSSVSSIKKSNGILQPLYDIELQSFSNQDLMGKYHKALQNEIPKMEAYYDKQNGKEGIWTTYQNFIITGGLSFTQPNSPERQAQVEGWKKYFVFELPNEDTVTFLLKKKYNTEVPFMKIEECIKNRAIRPYEFKIMQSYTYEQICYIAGHVPSAPKYKALHTQLLMNYYGLTENPDHTFSRDAGKMAKYDFDF